TGDVWTPTSSPVRTQSAYVVRHGHGYTVFEHRSHGLDQQLLLVVPPDDPIKLIAVRVRNLARRRRRLSATFYAEWALGTVRDPAAEHMGSEVDDNSGALLARNLFNPDFASRVAFADLNLRPRTFTADRTEFLGRNGSLAAPAALRKSELGGSAGATLDPC